jgi:hypothetical protein
VSKRSRQFLSWGGRRRVRHRLSTALHSPLTPCLASSHKNRYLCFVKGTYMAAERQLRHYVPATFHQTRAHTCDCDGTTANPTLSLALHGVGRRASGGAPAGRYERKSISWVRL